MNAFFAGRTFQLWQYRVGHGELLVRSPKNAAHQRNADLMFAGVEYVELPRFLPEPQVDEPTGEDVARVQERLGKSVERTKVTVLKSGGRRYLVVAAAMKFVESDMDIFDSPFD